MHFKVFNFPGPEYNSVRQEESEELRRERVRLWYVALTRRSAFRERSACGAQADHHPRYRRCRLAAGLAAHGPIG